MSPASASSSTGRRTSGETPSGSPGDARRSQTRATPEQHEKNTKRLKPSDRQDPAKVKLPPFYPDDPRVRNDLKQYHENVTALDCALMMPGLNGTRCSTFCRVGGWPVIGELM
mgnify:CR=1 FL=1